MARILADSPLPVIVMFHRADKDEDVVALTESAVRIAGRLTLARALVPRKEEQVGTPSWVVSHNGQIGACSSLNSGFISHFYVLLLTAGRARGTPCRDELVSFMLAVRALPMMRKTDPDYFIEAEFTGRPPVDYVPPGTNVSDE
jgi:hypothetical protein